MVCNYGSVNFTLQKQKDLKIGFEKAFNKCGKES